MPYNLVGNSVFKKSVASGFCVKVLVLGGGEIVYPQYLYCLFIVVYLYVFQIRNIKSSLELQVLIKCQYSEAISMLQALQNINNVHRTLL
jgi:hypothetical protein